MLGMLNSSTGSKSKVLSEFLACNIKVVVWEHSCFNLISTQSDIKSSHHYLLPAV